MKKGNLESEKERMKSFSYGLDKKSEHYVMIFFDSLQPLYLLEQRKEILVFLCMLQELSMNKNEIILTYEKKKNIADFLKTSLPTIRTTIHKLKTKYEIISGSNNTYYINPISFWKGNLNERRKGLKPSTL